MQFESRKIFKNINDENQEDQKKISMIYYILIYNVKSSTRAKLVLALKYIDLYFS